MYYRAGIENTANEDRTLSYTRINVEEARKLMNAGNAIVVDVRDPDSHRAGHIRGALHIDSSTVQDFIERTDLERPLIAYCYHGNMSQGAADYFNRNGFTTTYSLDGGYEAWESAESASVELRERAE